MTDPENSSIRRSKVEEQRTSLREDQFDLQATK